MNSITVDRDLLENLIGKGKINAVEALRLSPEFSDIAAALQAREQQEATIKSATGKLEVEVEYLIPLWVCARDLGWTTDNIANIYPAVQHVGALLEARGRQ